MGADFFQALAGGAEEEGLAFLLIGGNAVNAYGYQRTTLDVDLLVREGDLERWRGFWETRGYECVHETDAFCQFRSGDGEDRFPVDLMIVSEETFEKMRDGREVKAVGEVELEVPGPYHLIALKLHALKNSERAKEGRDLADIVGLIRACGLDVEGGEFVEIVDRYGTEAVRKEIERRLKGE
jgi:hypothetical protein